MSFITFIWGDVTPVIFGCPAGVLLEFSTHYPSGKSDSDATSRGGAFLILTIIAAPGNTARARGGERVAAAQSPVDFKPGIAESPRVFRKLGHVLLILALVGALGGHWAVLQTVAWTNMLATHLRTSSLEVAVTKTFDGNHPCGLCHEIKSGKKSEKKSELPGAAKKLEFVTDRPVFVFSPPADFQLRPAPSTSARQRGHQPPVPPPRRFPA